MLMALTQLSSYHKTKIIRSSKETAMNAISLYHRTLVQPMSMNTFWFSVFTTRKEEEDEIINPKWHCYTNENRHLHRLYLTAWNDMP